MRLILRLSEAVEATLAGEVVSPSVIAVNFTAGAHPLALWSAAGACWNNFDGFRSEDLPLLDTAGHSTTARLTFESTSAYAAFGAPQTLNSATNRLYCGGLVGNDTVSEVRVSVTGIPYDRYDVFVFASADTTDRSILSITDGRTTFYYRSAGRSNVGAPRLLRTRSRDPRAPTEGPAQYQVFRGRGESFTVTTGGSRNCVLSNNVFGLQIVRAGVERNACAAPDPAAK